ncbi:MAG: FGGY-family carbohydrate kinase [Hyphomicrobiales bacterium]
MSAVLGIDLGLSSARAAIFDRRGRLLGSGRNGAKDTQHAALDSMPKRWLAMAIAAARQALAAADRPRIDAIGIGAFGPCPVLLDHRLRPVMAAAMFSFSQDSEQHRQRLIRRHRIAEYQLGPDNTIPQLLWWRRKFPEAFARAAQVTDVAGFLVASLTGRAVIDRITLNDYTCPGLTPPVALPDILPADAMAGGLTAKMAAKLDLTAGTPVTAGSYDSHVDIAASGAVHAGQAAILLGSTIVMGMVVSDKLKAASAARHGLRLTPHVGRGQLLGGWTSASGSLIDWTDRLVGSSRAPDAEAEREPGMLVLPYFAGERAPVWDSLARGAIIGATLTTTANDLRRATLDGVALSTFDIGHRLFQEGGKKTHMRANGGGLRNTVWAQATADALGCRLDVVAHAGESIGPAALAMRALGHPFDPGIARAIAPDKRRHARYRKLYRIYRGLYPALRNSMHELGRLAEEGA